MHNSDRRKLVSGFVIRLNQTEGLTAIRQPSYSPNVFEISGLVNCLVYLRSRTESPYRWGVNSNVLQSLQHQGEKWILLLLFDTHEQGYFLTPEEVNYYVQYIWPLGRDGDYKPAAGTYLSRSSTFSNIEGFLSRVISYLEENQYLESSILLQDLEILNAEEEFFEGEMKRRFTNYHERNPRLRAAAIAIHGLSCMVCGFNFEEFYGERGAQFIEVHHLNPVSNLRDEIKINPTTDMAVVCSNCHRMIHRKIDDVLSIEEMKEVIRP
jgi:hypothetical protein